MRQKYTRQMSLFSVTARHDIGKELGVFSEILDATPEMLDRVYNDLIRNRRKETGRPGMTAEQVLRACVLKQYRSLTYEELAFHLEDSGSFRAFARLEMGQYPSSSTLQENIKPLSEETWEAIHHCLMQYATSTSRAPMVRCCVILSALRALQRWNLPKLIVAVDMNMRRFYCFMAMEVKPVWPRSKNCWHPIALTADSIAHLKVCFI